MSHTGTEVTSASAFEECAAASWPALYRYAYLLTGQAADAEDLAQQTLLKAYRSWPRVSASRAPMAYLRRMLTNTFVSERRPKKRRLEVLTDVPPEAAVAAGGAAEDRMVLWPHVASLAPRQRAVIVLRYYEDLSEQEIADALGCSRGTVKSSAHHALKTLRTALDSDGADDPHRKER